MVYFLINHEIQRKQSFKICLKNENTNQISDMTHNIERNTYLFPT